MNKELIKKYKAEFDHWLNDGKLHVGRYSHQESDGHAIENISHLVYDIAPVVFDLSPYKDNS